MPLHRQILLALIAGLLLAMVLQVLDPGLRAGVLEGARLIGTLFLNALKAVAIPLVVVTLIAGIGGLNQRLGRLGAIALSFYGLSTVLAIGAGLLVANVMAPGLHATAPEGGWLASAAAQGGSGTLPLAQDAPWRESLLAVVPANLFKAASEGNLLALVLLVMFPMLPGSSTSTTLVVALEVTVLPLP